MPDMVNHPPHYQSESGMHGKRAEICLPLVP